MPLLIRSEQHDLEVFEGSLNFVVWVVLNDDTILLAATF